MPIRSDQVAVEPIESRLQDNPSPNENLDTRIMAAGCKVVNYYSCAVLLIKDLYFSLYSALLIFTISDT